jgi:hypothetical protein
MQGPMRSGTENAATATADLAVTGTTDRGSIALTEHLTQPGSGFAQVRGVDLMAQLRLAVGEV